MLQLRQLTRYVLLLIPAIASMYFESYVSYSTYVFLILIFIWIAELRRKIRSNSTWLLLLEIGYSGWISYHYEGILFLTFFSTLVSYVHFINRHIRYACLSIQLILLNLSLHNQPYSTYVIANLIFLILTLLLLQMLRTEQNREEVELLYDQLRRQHYELDEARMQLVDYARKVETITQTDERNRISRDIHDELGHKLIRLKMMMEASLRILPTQLNKGIDLLTSVRDQLTDSMELLRSTVRRLKPDEDTLQMYSLSKLIEGLTRDNEISVEVQLEGMPYVLYPSLEFILYRNAQEAITNAIRHGSATQILIHLTYAPQEITMRISNNGIRPTEQRMKGLGMSGMEERSKLIGGQLVVSLEGQFTVTTVLPTYRQIEPA